MEKDSGVSTVLSEVLMIALVLILVPVATISLMNQLPEDRVPTVTIKPDISSDSIFFYQKGGDYVRNESIKLIIRAKDLANKDKETIYTHMDFNITWKGNPTSLFDLGSELTIKKDTIEKKGVDFSKIKDVRFIAKNTVLYTYQI